MHPLFHRQNLHLLDAFDDDPGSISSLFCHLLLYFLLLSFVVSSKGSPPLTFVVCSRYVSSFLALYFILLPPSYCQNLMTPCIRAGCLGVVMHLSHLSSSMETTFGPHFVTNSGKFSRTLPLFSLHTFTYAADLSTLRAMYDFKCGDGCN